MTIQQFAVAAAFESIELFVGRIPVRRHSAYVIDTFRFSKEKTALYTDKHKTAHDKHTTDTIDHDRNHGSTTTNESYQTE
jgi:hypothetical protein